MSEEINLLEQLKHELKAKGLKDLDNLDFLQSKDGSSLILNDFGKPKTLSHTKGQCCHGNFTKCSRRPELDEEEMIHPLKPSLP